MKHRKRIAEVQSPTLLAETDSHMPSEIRRSLHLLQGHGNSERRDARKKGMSARRVPFNYNNLLTFNFASDEEIEDIFTSIAILPEQFRLQIRF